MVEQHESCGKNRVQGSVFVPSRVVLHVKNLSVSFEVSLDILNKIDLTLFKASLDFLSSFFNILSNIFGLIHD